jgi:valyl-tRNA synthetase
MHLSILNNSKISKRDLFILSKLNSTIRDTNNQVTKYEFGGATTSLYSFFLYDVCDFYLETVKNIMYDKTPENEETKRVAQITLYTVIEQFLR